MEPEQTAQDYSQVQVFKGKIFNKLVIIESFIEHETMLQVTKEELERDSTENGKESRKKREMVLEI